MTTGRKGVSGQVKKGLIEPSKQSDINPKSNRELLKGFT